MASDIPVRTEGDVVVVSPAGELDAVTSPDLAAVLDAILTEPDPCRGVVIDFSRVTFCDSRCIGVLVASYRQARDRGIGLAVSAPQHMVHRLFVIAGIDQVITIDSDTSHAVEAVLA
ncbi:stage II sporulation protein AA (anti-sigma F factor antagonist) [Haloactinospora alba]|uniref:Anti-sigma factor antagonist n=1 Tax=Haloactinospora alba TaxID=405555 RepID=A0A543N7G3_9ACTN|nr:STAS domain-containing protein [Haloactinospora alba]TQN27747.1 stage II sporulation protein AA (anti-sigma F factor antagonist) [Haloactinospora alba]